MHLNVPDYVIVASGPSLTLEQCNYVSEYQNQGGCIVISVNRTHELLEPDIIYAADRQWWGEYYHDTLNHKRANRKITICRDSAEQFSLELLRHLHGRNGLSKTKGLLFGKNSGYHAINLAYQEGAKRIILLGFDMAVSSGKVHWHKDYPNKFCNGPKSYDGWIAQFNTLAEDLREEGVDVFNCSESTALECFQKADIRDIIRMQRGCVTQ